MGSHAPSPMLLAVNFVNIRADGEVLMKLTKAESNSHHPIDVINIAVGLSALHYLTCLQVCEFANLQNNRFTDWQIRRFAKHDARSSPSVIHST